MPKQCIIPDCFGERNRPVFRVPKNVERREKWIKAIHDVYFNLDVGKSFCVCEKHFRNRDFSSYIADESGKIVHEVTVKRKRLKHSAVPHFDVLNSDSNNYPAKTILMEQDEPKDDPVIKNERIDGFQDYPIDIDEIKIEKPERDSPIPDDIIAMPEFIKVEVEDPDYCISSSNERNDGCPVEEQMSSIEGNTNPFTCDVSPKKDLDGEEKPFACSVCPLRFTQHAHLEKHMRIHTEEKPFTCTVCSNKFRQKGTLVKHMRIHTGEKPYTCEVCSQKFRSNSTLDKHIRIHTDEKPYTCGVCAAKFRAKSTLNSHIRTHTGEKPFTCDICSVRFRLKNTLNVHRLTHAAEKPYTCNVCPLKFAQKSYLSKHVRIHTGERPAQGNLENSHAYS